MDSDSSDEYDSGYAETNVLLGYATKAPIEEDSISRLGGVPTWIVPDIPPSSVLARCNVCREMMVLLLQLNGELPKTFPGHERRLHVFSCRQKACRRKEGSVKAIRGVRVQNRTSPPRQDEAVPKISQKTPPTNMGQSLFGIPAGSSSSNFNPFARSSSSSATSSNPFSSPSAHKAETRDAEGPDDLVTTFAQKAAISKPAQEESTTSKTVFEPWPPANDLPKAYPYYHLDADYETLEQPEQPEQPNGSSASKPDVDMSEQDSNDKEKETFESFLDKAFQGFADRLAQNPTQVLRYEFGGSPLLYSHSDAVSRLFIQPRDQSSKIKIEALQTSKIPRCQNCNAVRTFELQLTPHAIDSLEAEESGLDGMDWGTIIVGVCSKDCFGEKSNQDEASYFEEWVGVQWEEISSKK